MSSVFNAVLMGSSTEAEAVEVKQIGGDDVGEREEMESEEMRGGGREGGNGASQLGETCQQKEQQQQHLPTSLL